MPGCSFGHPRHLGLRELGPGRGAGAGQHGGQDTDPGRFRAGGRRLHRRRHALRAGGTARGRHDQGAIQHLPAQFSLGPRPSTGPGEPGVAGTRFSAGPGDSPLTIDLDSTICETYGLAKEGARHHGYTALQAGLSPAACRRRNRRRADVGCARAGPTARGAAHFLRETVGRVRCNSRCGPTAAFTPIAWYPSAASWTCASPSPSASTKACGT